MYELILEDLINALNYQIDDFELLTVENILSSMFCECVFNELSLDSQSHIHKIIKSIVELKKLKTYCI